MQPTQRNHNKMRKLAVFPEDSQLQKFLEVNFTESLKQMIKVTVNTLVKTEMEKLRQELGEKLYFNGTYGRNMTSSFGRVEDIPIPRFRQSPAGIELQSLSVFEAEQAKFARLVEQMHLLGISQRKIKHLAQGCFGITLSTTKVGAIYKELAEKESVNINQKPLDDQWEYLLLDGIWEKTKGYGWDDNASVLLCALGIKPDGSRQILAFDLTREESSQSWKQLLISLKQRGLTGANLKLIIADDHAGIKAAVDTIYPNIPLQNCIIHKMRNVLRKTSYKTKAQVAEDLKAIYASTTKEEATNKAKATVKKWYLTEPKAMEALRFNFELTLTYLDFPQDQWKKLRTTNILEREFRELRRRMKVFDSTFQNQQSGERYANTIINYLNQNYPLSRGGLHTNAWHYPNWNMHQPESYYDNSRHIQRNRTEHIPILAESSCALISILYLANIMAQAQTIFLPLICLIVLH